MNYSLTTSLRTLKGLLIGMTEIQISVTKSHTTVTESQSGCGIESLEETKKKEIKKQDKKEDYFVDPISENLYLFSDSIIPHHNPFISR